MQAAVEMTKYPPLHLEMDCQERADQISQGGNKNGKGNCLPTSPSLIGQALCAAWGKKALVREE